MIGISINQITTRTKQSRTCELPVNDCWFRLTETQGIIINKHWKIQHNSTQQKFNTDWCPGFRCSTMCRQG